MSVERAMKKIGSMLLIAMMVLSGTAFGSDKKAKKHPESCENEFPGRDHRLTKGQAAALRAGRRWRRNVLPPVAAPAGAVRFSYGLAPVDLVCEPLQITDVQLEAGEKIQNVNVGDPRWDIEPAMTGEGESATPHLIIKPLDVGLETSLVITTSRRTYHLRLRSDRKGFMSFVTFFYPEEEEAKWKAIEKKNEEQKQKLPIPKEYLGDLDFGYEVKGKSRWKPLRVYNDGKKTIIQMPTVMNETEAPALLILRGGKETLANYRIQQDRYIVDTVFDKAVLVAGTGWHQEKITIIRTDAGTRR